MFFKNLVDNSYCSKLAKRTIVLHGLFKFKILDFAEQENQQTIDLIDDSLDKITETFDKYLFQPFPLFPIFFSSIIIKFYLK